MKTLRHVLPFGASGSNSIYCLRDGPAEVERAVGADGGEIQMSMGNLSNDGYDGDTQLWKAQKSLILQVMYKKTMEKPLSIFKHHQT